MVSQRRAKGDGSIGRRKEDGLWYARIDLGCDASGRRRTRTMYSRTRSGVVEELQTLRERQWQGLPLAIDRGTVGKFLDGWLEDAVRPTARPRTHESYAQLVRVYIAPAIGHHQFRRLEPAHVQNMLNSLVATGKSLRTARYALAVLRRALERTVLGGQVTRYLSGLCSCLDTALNLVSVNQIQPAHSLYSLSKGFFQNNR